MLLAAGIGNFIEWYDFIVYGFVAPILAPLFFPSADFVTSLLATFVVFGVGFGLRPIGGLVLGPLGDRYGRRLSLVLVISLMAVGTTMLGCAPTFAQVGIVGPIVLVCARAIQGFAIGGEFASSSAFIVEYAPPGQRGRYGGWQMFSQMAGLFAGAVVSGAMINVLSPDAARVWGWRVAFLLAVPLIAVAMYVRWRLADTPVFERAEKVGTEAAPLRTSLRRNWRQLLNGIGVLCLPGIAVYALFVSMPAYLVATEQVPLSTGLISTIIGLGVFTVVIPPAAALTDSVGRRPVFLAGALITTALAYPAYMLIGTKSVAAIVAAQVVMGIVLGIMHAPVPAILVEAFGTRTRVSSVAISYGIATAVFSGSAPYLTTWLTSVTHDARIPGVLVAAAGLITIASGLTMPETANKELTV
ncbi:MFS transporter [Nocardia sp. NPDC004604]|uniref:MFS transporter n=1 Tax=Nocardia sp. NPDC004604 TaxID=3157013 RepID=UPI0033B2412A